VSRGTGWGETVATEMIACSGEDDTGTDEDGAVGHAEGGVCGTLGCESEHGLVLSHFMLNASVW
jgi:hypothetical protein